MACCRMAPSHKPMLTNDQWGVDNNFTKNTWDIYHWNEFEIYQSEAAVNPPPPPGANELNQVKI